MLELVQSKIMTAEVAAARTAGFGVIHNRIVFTNGCFDLLHPGHLTYLAQARALGGYLVVGLNSDASVRQLKGADRPLMDEAARAFALASLCFVDAVCIFTEETPLNLIKTIKPDLLVKGGDYEPDTIVGADFVRSLGGEVEVLPFVPGYSTTQIIEQIRKG